MSSLILSKATVLSPKSFSSAPSRCHSAQLRMEPMKSALFSQLVWHKSVDDAPMLYHPSRGYRVGGIAG